MSNKHPCTSIDSNAIAARNIVRSIIGKGCDYADGRKNGVRYKWIFWHSRRPNLNVLRTSVETALANCNIKNFVVSIHNHPTLCDATSVTLRKV